MQARNENRNTDDELVGRSLDAREAFDEIVRRHHAMVYSVAFARIGQREAAEEIAQETFLRAYLNLESLREPGALGGWLMRIARNLAEDWRLRGRTRSRLVQMVSLDESVVEVADERQLSARESLAAREHARAVHDALAKLPAPDRELVTMHFMEGISKSDLARRMGVYPSTVTRQLDKALGFLRRELGSVFSAAPSVLKPSRSGAVRAGLVVAAAQALSPSARAELVSAASCSMAPGGLPSKALSVSDSKPDLFISPSGAKLMIGSTLLLVTGGLTLLLRLNAGGPPPFVPAQPVSDITWAEPPPRLVARALPPPPPASPVTAEQPPPQGMEILATREAEDAIVAGQNNPHVEKDSWASGGARVDNWGEQGDTIEWEADFPSPQTNLQLGVRYAYHAENHRKPVPETLQTHKVHFYIDGQGPVEIPIEDTNGWNWFKVATVQIPALSEGRHAFRIVSPAAGNAANFDCFTFFRGTIDPVPPSPLRTSVVDQEGENFTILASPRAVLPASPQSITETFEQLRSIMVEDFGVTPPRPYILVHFSDPAHWDTSHGRAVKNADGIYLLADGEQNRADWCWALAEYFGDQQLPRWFRDSSARVSGLLDWLPAIDETTTTYEDLDAADLMSEAHRVLEDDDCKTSRVEVIHTAVRLKYGSDVFRRFWHLVRDDGQSAPDAPQILDKLAVMELLSRAAGSDVTPLYRQWRGFADEGPVDPLVVTDVQAKM